MIPVYFIQQHPGLVICGVIMGYLVGNALVGVIRGIYDGIRDVRAYRRERPYDHERDGL